MGGIEKEKISPVVWRLLVEAMDRMNGEWSGLPDCCIDAYVAERYYAQAMEGLSEDELERLRTFGYVPCPSCFATDNKVAIRKNGYTPLGTAILAVVKELGIRPWE